MRYFQGGVWNFLCGHYFRLETEGWHQVPDGRPWSSASTPAARYDGRVDAGAFLVSPVRGRRILHGTAHDVLMAAPLLGDYFKAVGVIPANRKGVPRAWRPATSGRWPGGEQDAMPTGATGTRRSWSAEGIYPSGHPLRGADRAGGDGRRPRQRLRALRGTVDRRVDGPGKRLRGATMPIIAGFRSRSPWRFCLPTSRCRRRSAPSPRSDPGRKSIRRAPTTRPTSRRSITRSRRDPGRNGPAGQTPQLPGAGVSSDAPTHQYGRTVPRRRGGPDPHREQDRPVPRRHK